MPRRYIKKQAKYGGHEKENLRRYILRVRSQGKPIMAHRTNIGLLP